MHRGEPRQQAPAPQQREAAAAAVQPQAGVGDAEPGERLQRLLGQIVDAAVEGADEEAADLEGQEQPEQHQRSEEHTSELQSLMRNSSAVFRLKKKHTPT